MNTSKLNWLLALTIALILTACGGSQKDNETQKKDQKEEVQTQTSETDLLLTYIEKTGDFINSPAVPAMIKASEVKENIGNPKYLVLDIRKEADYLDGHIEGAVHVSEDNILNYLTTKSQPGNYKKIALVCYSGQSASYVTSILRLMGYANVYAMKWGMCAWSPKYAQEKWLKNINTKFKDKIDTISHAKAPKGNLPTISTGKTDGLEILEAQASEILKTPFKQIIRKIDAVMEKPEQYYIINYWPEQKYKVGHLPNSVQYTPKKSLSRAADLSTLPTDKPILTYCFTGQHSAFVTAYLRLLGYDAYSLVFGANSFMYKTMKEGGEGWKIFSKKEINNFPTVKGEKKEKTATASKPSA